MVADLRVARAGELRTRLLAMQDAYTMAKAEVRSEAWRQREQAVLGRVMELLNQFLPGDSGEKAIFLLGQCQGSLLAMGGPMAVIAEYEALKESLGKLEAALPRKEPAEA